MAEVEASTLLTELNPTICVLTIAAVSGGIGGSVYPLIGSDSESAKKEFHSFAARLSVFAASSWIGVVGAIGFLFIEVSLGSIQFALKDIQIVRLFSLGVIAGFGARKLIPMISGQLSKQVEQHERMLKETRTKLALQEEKNEDISIELAKLEDYKKNSEIENDLMNVISGDAAISEYPNLMKKASQIIKDKKAKSSLVMWYAMQLKRDGNIVDAIEVLEKALQNFPANNRNRSRMHYNLACYYSLLASNPENISNGKKAVYHFEAAIKGESDGEILRKAAQSDEDLAWLRVNTDIGKKLFGAPEGAPN